MEVLILTARGVATAEAQTRKLISEVLPKVETKLVSQSSVSESEGVVRETRASAQRNNEARTVAKESSQKESWPKWFAMLPLRTFRELIVGTSYLVGGVVTTAAVGGAFGAFFGTIAALVKWNAVGFTVAALSTIVVPTFMLAVLTGAGIALGLSVLLGKLPADEHGIRTFVKKNITRETN